LDSDYSIVILFFTLFTPFTPFTSLIAKSVSFPILVEPDIEKRVYDNPMHFSLYRCDKKNHVNVIASILPVAEGESKGWIHPVTMGG
jgi:hypothetical protein